MALALPLSPAPRSATPRLMSRRRDLEPTFGGPVSRVQRLGARWALDVEMPPMLYVEAMAWIAALTTADADTVLLNVPQPGFDAGSPGTPLVNGANQQGQLLNLDGFDPYEAKAGQFFSIATAGRRFLYQVSANKVAVAGAMNGLQFAPMIRRSPHDNAAVEFTAPMIEGFLSGREAGWTVDVARTVGLAFTITERE